MAEPELKLWQPGSRAHTPAMMLLCFPEGMLPRPNLTLRTKRNRKVLGHWASHHSVTVSFKRKSPLVLN